MNMKTKNKTKLLFMLSTLICAGLRAEILDDSMNINGKWGACYNPVNLPKVNTSIDNAVAMGPKGRRPHLSGTLSQMWGSCRTQEARVNFLVRELANRLQNGSKRDNEFLLGCLDSLNQKDRRAVLLNLKSKSLI